jgi:hypothetical protein
VSKTQRRRTSEIENDLRYVEGIIYPTELQQEILHHLCTTTKANYKTLTKQTGRDRITILQSIESLIHFRYVEKERDDPQKEKSKLTFLPTLKGVACLWKSSFIDLNFSERSFDLDRWKHTFDLKEMIKMKKENEITMYLEFVKDVFNLDDQEPMVSRLFNYIEYNYLKLEEQDVERKKLIKTSFIMGMLELARRDYSATKLLDKKVVQWLTKLFSKEELNEFKELFVRTKKNLTTVIERFPVS